MDHATKEDTHNVKRGASHSHKAPNHGRQYDRKSGTGRRENTKRSGKGAFNWGCDTDVYEDAVEVAQNEDL
eukprot:CAMPEP_0194578888 /NCGR_PEP_ID=MMETSP0292-20121207/13153_1 /TAXON_ID=39354 /ORGANISM="Heterosigma akashiwo, Strain CCMP2393" /LENGTH=70 /DNA_ID=CAMNT_0039431687 /DNA_START=319 /DNA_END=531 /DNA_ORIENTATION=+